MDRPVSPEGTTLPLMHEEPAPIAKSANSRGSEDGSLLDNLDYEYMKEELYGSKENSKNLLGLDLSSVEHSYFQTKDLRKSLRQGNTFLRDFHRREKMHA